MCHVRGHRRLDAGAPSTAEATGEGRNLARGHRSPRGLVRSNRKTTASALVVVVSPESDRSDDGDVCRGGPERGEEGDDGLAHGDGEETARTTTGINASAVTRLACHSRAPGHGGDIAGGGELRLQWWSGLRRDPKTKTSK